MGWLLDLIAPKSTAPPVVIQESAWDSPYDPDAEHSAAQMGTPYVRKLTSKTQRDIPEITFTRAMQYAYYLSTSNPLAKGILKLTRSFVVGDGITVSATNPEEETEIQTVIDRFWDDERNHLDMMLPQMVYELGLFGELIPTVFVNPVDGHVRLGVIDPEDVNGDGGIICEPGDITHQVAIELKPPLGKTLPPRYRIIEEIEDVNDEWYGRLKGVAMTRGIDEQGQPTVTVSDTYKAANGEEVPYAGACFLFQVNKIRNRKRGQSDLLDLLDWIDAYGQLLFNDVDRALLMKSFIFDVKITGSEQEVNTFIASNKAAPLPGSVRAHTDKVEWNTVEPDMKTHDTAMTAELLLNLIATGSGLAKHWIGASMDVNRATADSMTEPVVKMLTERQQYVKFMVGRIMRFVLDQAEMTNRLPRRPTTAASLRPEPWPIVVNAPEIGSKDIKSLANIFTEIIQALSVALADRAIDLQTYQDLLAFISSQIGYEIDLDEMRERLEKQKAEEDAEMADQRRQIANGNGSDDEELPGMQDMAVLARGNR